ncbi:beta-1,6-N-acetylglucosaminyltransferase [Carnobacterium inhibens]|uniref:Peptide O-xylosyltransferase n=1 Tax=Carnobacterium inhibens TaxID=147709 RepID=A0ABR7TDB5_9LACT|nr:beta-1,6-N-acetylglucosaminyltransferase [Carnobacterium inhibens]MBC9825919.1 hypothetical protein [Carnobacterium inhibens]
MVIAYLILCHKDPDFIYRVAKKLTVNTDNEVYIHVDSKFNLEPFKNVKTLKNVYLIEEREKNYWGGFNSVKATVNLFNNALKGNAQRFIVLQGTDYPVKSNKYINDFFEKNKDIEFCKAFNLSTSKEKKNYMKVYGYHSFDLDRNEINFKALIAKFFSLINRFGVKYKKGFYIRKETYEKYDYYWGWAQIALTRQCVKYIVEFYDNNYEFNQNMKHKFPPDEIYIPTILYNSIFREKIGKLSVISEKEATNENMLNLTYFEYPTEVKLYKNIKDIDLENLKDFLFIRKVNSESKKLLEFIDEKYSKDEF